MRASHLIGLVVLAAIWGASFMFVKVMVHEMSPVAVAWLRLAGGAAIVGVVAVIRRSRVSLEPRFWFDLSVFAAFSSAIPFVLIPLAQQFIPANLAAILNSSTPLWTSLFAFVLLPLERLSRVRVAGLVLGFVGVAMVIGPEALGMAGSGVLGELFMLGASCCYGIAAVYFRRTLIGGDTVFMAAAQNVVAFAMMTPVVLATNSVPHFAALSAAAVWSSLGLGVLCSGFAMIIYYWLLQNVTATQASAVTYLVPVSAVFWSLTVLGEHLDPRIIPGLLLVAFGVYLINRRPRVQPARTAVAVSEV